jgi:hypothetical protein
VERQFDAVNLAAVERQFDAVNLAAVERQFDAVNLGAVERHDSARRAQLLPADPYPPSPQRADHSA